VTQIGQTKTVRIVRADEGLVLVGPWHLCSAKVQQRDRSSSGSLSGTISVIGWVTLGHHLRHPDDALGHPGCRVINKVLKNDAMNGLARRAQKKAAHQSDLRLVCPGVSGAQELRHGEGQPVAIEAVRPVQQAAISVPRRESRRRCCHSAGALHGSRGV
jgi:hypothetical protein